MVQAIKMFEQQKLRAAWDTKKKTWWVSVIDVIAALRGTDYDTARNYWKQIKHRMARKKKVFKSHQLKLTCKDGRQRFSDVMLYNEIVQLIQILPSNKARVLKNIKKLIGSLAAKTMTLADIFSQACTKQQFSSQPLMQTTVVRKIL